MLVFVPRHIPEIGLQTMRDRGIEVVVHKGIKNKKQLIKELKKRPYEGLVSLLQDTIDGEVLDAAPTLRIVSNYAVGYNNIVLEDAKERGVIITNTPGVLTNTVAEHTVALILAASTRLVEADTFVRKGKFTGWEPELLLGRDLRGRRLGIVGAGRIGTRVAEIMFKGFGMEILYHDRNKNKHIEECCGAQFRPDIESMIRDSDVISIHLPLTDATHHTFNEQRLRMLKQTAIIVNTSRGPVIDEKALTIALSNGVFAGAALDVFEEEPYVSPTLRRLSNVILTPHIASASTQTRNAMSRLVADNIVGVLLGGKPTTEVV